MATTVNDYTALISGSTVSGGTGKAVFVSYSFPTSVPEYLYRSYSASGLATFQQFSDAAKTTARAAIAAWSAVSGITFFEVAPGDGDIKFMDFDLAALGSTAAGFAFFPDDGYSSSISSDVFIGHQYITGLHILLHELGHAIGLKHPFEGDVVLAGNLDNFSHTVMSYTPGGYPGDVLGDLDIAAIRALYGNEGNKGTEGNAWAWNATTLTLTQTGGAGTDTIFGIGGNDVIDGKDGDDTIDGKDGVNFISGGVGNDTLTGGNGYNHLSGGDGDDRLQITTDQSVLQFDIDGGAGNDSLLIYAFGFRGATFSIPDAIAAGSKLTGVESVTMSVGSGQQAYTVVGSDVRDSIFVNAGNDTVRGGGGNDFINAGAGNDTLYGDDGNDTLNGGDGNDVAYGGNGDDYFTLTLGGTDFIDGGPGSDSVSLTAASGATTLNLSTDQLAQLGITLSGIEFLSVTGTAGADALTGTGNYGYVALYGGDGSDILRGGAGNGSSMLGQLDGGAGDDVIYGGAAAHFMYGRDGADRFVYTSSAGSTYDFQDQLEDFQTGVDKLDLSGLNLWNLRIEQSGSYKLVKGDGMDGPFQLLVKGAIVSGDILTSASQPAPIAGTGAADTRSGTGVADYLFGDAGNDTLSGLGGNDLIDGGTGTDKLYGGAGDDSYYVDRQDDLVFENAGEGTDTVYTTSSFYLYANIENLKIGGFSSFFGVGNDLDNLITGNYGNNTLLGGAGADTVHGGSGIDIIYGEAGNDRLFGDDDNDTIIGGIGDDVMDGGAGGDSLYGEAGNDTLTGGTTFEFDQLVGGDGNDILHGDSGQSDYDYLYGNTGDDSFYVDTGDDLTFEQAGEGTDTVYANVPGSNNGVYLYANVENLVLLGTTRFGVGNELANQLTGNAGTNLLLGGDGADTINGKGGNDVLFGQGGADTFVFEHGTGGDVIGDFVAGTDKIDLKAIGYTWAQVQTAFHQNGGDLAIDLGAGDLIVLQGVNASQLHQADFILAGGASAVEPVGFPALAAMAANDTGHGVIATHLWHGAGAEITASLF